MWKNNFVTVYLLPVSFLPHSGAISDALHMHLKYILYIINHIVYRVTYYGNDTHVYYCCCVYVFYVCVFVCVFRAHCDYFALRYVTHITFLRSLRCCTYLYTIYVVYRLVRLLYVYYVWAFECQRGCAGQNAHSGGSVMPRPLARLYTAGGWLVRTCATHRASRESRTDSKADARAIAQSVWTTVRTTFSAQTRSPAQAPQAHWLT